MLDLSWSRNRVISEMLVNPNPNPPAQEADVTQTKGATFNITKYYALVVTLSINDNKFLENLKQKFKRTISWNKYQSEIQYSLKHELDYILIQHFRILIGYLFFYSKTVTMIIRKIPLVSIICH